MPQTKELTIDCSSLRVESYTYKILRVILEEPDITDIFTSLDANDFIKYVKENFKPDDIYPNDTLGEWAEKNGYTKEENQ